MWARRLETLLKTWRTRQVWLEYKMICCWSVLIVTVCSGIVHSPPSQTCSLTSHTCWSPTCASNHLRIKAADPLLLCQVVFTPMPALDSARPWRDRGYLLSLTSSLLRVVTPIKVTSDFTCWFFGPHHTPLQIMGFHGADFLKTWFETLLWIFAGQQTLIKCCWS